MAGLFFAIVLLFIYLELFKKSGVAGWITFATFIIGIMIAGFAELSRIMHTYYIAEKEITEKFSFLSRRIISASYSKIQNLELKQGLFERMVNIGDLEFYTAADFKGSKRPEIVFRGIKNPLAIKNIIAEIKPKE